VWFRESNSLGDAKREFAATWRSWLAKTVRDAETYRPRYDWQVDTIAAANPHAAGLRQWLAPARHGRTSRAARLVAPPGQTDNIPRLHSRSARTRS
jgi:hypothetical protein